jgi:hypothetical protein
MVMRKNSTISHAFGKYGRLISAKDRTEFLILKFAFVGVVVSALTNFLIFGTNSGLTNAFAWANVKKWALILTAMFTSSVALIYFFVSLLKRRTRETDELKAKFVKAIHQALEQSSFNPHLNKQHERRTR